MERLEQSLTVRLVCCASSVRLWRNQVVCLQGSLQTPKYLLKCSLLGGGRGRKEGLGWQQEQPVQGCRWGPACSETGKGTGAAGVWAGHQGMGPWMPSQVRTFSFGMVPKAGRNLRELKAGSRWHRLLWSLAGGTEALSKDRRGGRVGSQSLEDLVL